MWGGCRGWADEADSVPDRLESLLVGRLAGWWLPVGGGALHCQPDTDGLPRGPACTFLYPDLNTALHGHWEAERLAGAAPGRLVGLDTTGPLPRPLVELESGTGQVYRQEVSTAVLVAELPLLEDPYEQRTVYVAESGQAGAGEGLFLKRDLAPGDLAALYNGARLSESESRLRAEDRRSPYRLQGWAGTVLNIPPTARLTSQYRASLAHKANHDKRPNAEYRLLEHPRWGRIVGLYMLQPGKAGQEILVDYGYTEKYLATQAGLQFMLQAAQLLGGYEDKMEFKHEMKRTIGFVREKISDLKPFIHTFKLAKNFIS